MVHEPSRHDPLRPHEIENASFNNGDRSSEDVLRGIFSAFGLVQTCIVNVEKRHAFVKMLTRAEAMIAKEGMERYKSSEMQLRVRNPVRNCSLHASATLPG